MYKKEERFEMIYEAKGERRSCYPRSLEQKDKNIEKCRELGYKVLSCKKLYPFNTAANQHNFMLVSNVAFNRIRDMENGEVQWNDAEIERLEDLKRKADECFEWPLPTAWRPWNEIQEAKQLVVLAVEHRVNANIAAGNTAWLQYC